MWPHLEDEAQEDALWYEAKNTQRVSTRVHLTAHGTD